MVGDGLTRIHTRRGLGRDGEQEQESGVEEEQETVEQAFETDKRVVVVAFAHRWSPPGMETARALDSLRKERSSSVASYTHIYVVDADGVDSVGDITALGLAVTPSVFLFYAGTPFTIRRPGLDDDIRFIGSISRDSWEDLIQYARSTGDAGHSVLLCNNDA